MSCSSILRIGGVGNNGSTVANLLKEALASHFDPSLSSNAGADRRGDGGGNHGIILNLENKYFSSCVLLQDLTDGIDVDNDDNNNNNNQHQNAVGPDETTVTTTKKEDGIILVFDDRPSSTSATTTLLFDSLTSFHAMAERNDQCGELLRLCVGITSITTGAAGSSGISCRRNTKEYEEEYSRRVLWCLDRGYEYVEAVDLSEEGRSAGHDVRDKDGFARIVEAVSGTVWSSAIMSGSRGGGTTQKKCLHEINVTPMQETTSQMVPPAHLNAQALASVASSACVSSSAESDVPPSSLTDKVTDASKEQHPTMSEPATQILTDLQQRRRREAENKEAVSKEGNVSLSGGTARTINSGSLASPNHKADCPIEKKEEEATNISIAGAGAGAATTMQNHSHTQKIEEAEKERMFDDLEHLMREASRIREAAKIGSLPDDDRRQRAGDTALMLMDLLDKMDFGDDDDDDDGEEQEHDSSDNES